MTMTAAAPLAERIPPRTGTPPDELLDLFLGHVRTLGLELYPAQEEAILELFSGNHVILATPTGSGKSLVALALHFLAMSEGKRSFYTAPIKALVNEKFFALCRDFGPENVGMITGDAAVNRDAPIVCCTAEILSNMALRQGKDAPVDCVVMDEFHYYSDRDRGVAWQVPLLLLERVQFLLMSATLGPTEFFEKDLLRRTRRTAVTVRSTQRPVPLDFEYRESPLHETIVDLVTKGRSPVYLVNFTQRSVAETAQDLMSLDFISKEQKRTIQEALAKVRFDTPYGKEMKRFLPHGIGLHHAGLLPKYRLVVEKLAQRGLLAVISGTDTLGVGVNIPLRTVLFTRLCKFDGEKTAILTVRDFQQISGRAGRRGFDERGYVVAQAPEHVVENRKLEAKAGNDPVKLKRIVRKKPPERGYVAWDKATFTRLETSLPEPLVSRFRVTHGMLLELLGRREHGCREVARVIHRSHERRAQRRIYGREAKAMFEALAEAGLIEVDPDTKAVRVQVDLQDDFSLHHALSLWLIDALARLDRESPTYALDVLTLVESILEDPDYVLRQQLDVLKGVKIGEMKAAGMEYEERMAELEKLEYPKPLREFVYETFNEFRRIHPWVRGDDVRPKSIAREMVERFMDFNEYVRDYELGRAEGTLLRYLSEVYKALVQTVPAPAKTPAIDEIEVFLRAMVQAVDSSLLDEWERMRNPEAWAANVGAEAVPDEAPGEIDVTRDAKAFTVLVRNAMFQLLRAAGRRDWGAAASLVRGGTPEALEAAFAPFYAEHPSIRLDPSARAPDRTRIAQEPTSWEVVQVVSDPEGDDDWAVFASIDLSASREAASPVVTLQRVSR